jgi:hypothetical protein
MTKAKDNLALLFKGTSSATGGARNLPEPLGQLLNAASGKDRISHEEARRLLAEVKDVVLEETGLTRQQLDYELYLRTVTGE